MNSESIFCRFFGKPVAQKFSVAMTVGNLTLAYAQPPKAFPVDEAGILRVNMNLFANKRKAQKGTDNGVLDAHRQCFPHIVAAK
jgi:hypothetical protein